MTVSILEKARIAEQYVFSTKGYKSGEGNVVYNYDDNNKFRWNMAIYPINSDNRRMLFYKSSAGCMLALCDKKGNIIWKSSISTDFERCINLAKVRNILKESASFDAPTKAFLCEKAMTWDIKAVRNGCFYGRRQFYC